jgi:hypothetical protein
VTLNTGSAYTYNIVTLTKGGVTNAAGQIQFQIQDLETQVLSVTATDATAAPPVTLYKPLSVSIYR